MYFTACYLTPHSPVILHSNEIIFKPLLQSLSEMNSSSSSMQKTVGLENVDGSTIGKPVAKTLATWDPESHKFFIKLCVDEVRAGNRPSSHFNKVGWNNIQKKFAEKTGKNYNRLQLKNHWDGMKKEWLVWEALVGKETGLRWDAKKKTIDASDEWWNNKIQRNPKCAKFREKGLDHCLELDELFMDTAATGSRAWAPNSGEMPPIFSQSKSIELYSTQSNFPSDDEISEIPSLNNINPTIEVESDVEHSIKRARVVKSMEGKRKKVTTGTKLEKQLERLVDAFEARSRATVVVPKKEEMDIQECMDLLDEIPDIIRLDNLFMFATQLFLKSENRSMFIALRDPDARVTWLKHEQERQYNAHWAS